MSELPTASGTAVFSIRDLTFSYPQAETPALQALSLEIEPGAFVVLFGPSGCGKSTLLRQLKPLLTPHGRQTGEILFEGAPLSALDQRTQSARIGFVMQSPDNQIVTDKVWHELAFGLESLGYDTPTIRRRVAEMASFFGIQNWFYRPVAALSGGQRQLLNLASVMVLQPSVLILDEPTSQLDPIAASAFLSTLGRINRELGTTILLTEHRLEEAFSLATRVAAMDQGRLLCTGTPQQVGAALRTMAHPMFLAMPTAMRVWAATDDSAPCPVTIRDGRNWLRQFAAHTSLQALPPAPEVQPGAPVIRLQEVWFRYAQDAPDVVWELSVTVHAGELLAITGGNGTGKTTTLRLLAGLSKAYRGTLWRRGSVGMLPQSPQTLFVKKTVREDLLEVLPEQARRQAQIDGIVQLCGLQALLDRHPYDLSGGEQQRAALAKVLLLDPEILLMDEPTKGLDAAFKQTFAGILEDLLRRGKAIVMVSHDIEFCAQYAHRCVLFFDGTIVAEGAPRAFFSGNSFYTTPANRMAREQLPEAVTPEEVICACGGQLPTPPQAPTSRPAPPRRPAPAQAERLPVWRRVLAALAGLAALAAFFAAIGQTDLSALVDMQGAGALSHTYLWIYAVLLLCLLLVALAVFRRAPAQMRPLPVKRRLERRTLAAAGLILLLIPVTLLWGALGLHNRKYYFIALLVLLECMLPFFLVFEGRKPQARELVLIAALCAIGVAGRAAFFMLPQFKPVLALTILAGVALGAETGFLVGSVTMLASNMLFSQGPWTPWQMFAMGIIGFLAGLLCQKGLLPRRRGPLSVFGALCAIVIYGGILNPVSALLWQNSLNWNILLTYYLTGFPMDCIHAAATAFFLWFAAEPMLEKLERIKVKYGLISDSA